MAVVGLTQPLTRGGACEETLVALVGGRVTLACPWLPGRGLHLIPRRGASCTRCWQHRYIWRSCWSHQWQVPSSVAVRGRESREGVGFACQFLWESYHGRAGLTEEGSEGARLGIGSRGGGCTHVTRVCCAHAGNLAQQHVKIE